MPSIENLKIKKNKKFEKVEFRPWDTPPKEENHSNENSDIELVKRKDGFENVEQVSKSVQIFSVENLRKVKRRLYGPQKDVISYLLKIVDFKEEDKFFLKPMVYVEVSEELSVTLSTLKSILNKFKKEGLIELYDYKPGRGGYGCYVISENVYSFFSE